MSELPSQTRMKIFAPGFYTNVFCLGFLALIVFAVIIPTVQVVLAPRGKTHFRLSEFEMASLKTAADRGSAASARRIYEHFVYFERDRAKAHLWLERAAILGDEDAKRYMKSIYDAVGLDGY